MSLELKSQLLLGSICHYLPKDFRKQAHIQIKENHLFPFPMHIHSFFSFLTNSDFLVINVFHSIWEKYPVEKRLLISFMIFFVFLQTNCLISQYISDNFIIVSSCLRILPRESSQRSYFILCLLGWGRRDMTEISRKGVSRSLELLLELYSLPGEWLTALSWMSAIPVKSRRKIKYISDQNR